MRLVWSRLARYGGTFVIGLLLGAALVFWNMTRPMLHMIGLTTALHQDEKAYVSYRYGTYPVVRRALLEHINWVAEFARQQSDGPSLGKGSPSDLMLWYGRLALVAERAGMQSEALSFTQQALEKARASGADMTEAQVRAIVLKQDAEWDASLGNEH